MIYSCFIRPSGAPEPTLWVGTDMHVVITGRHQNGWMVTLAGDAALGFDDADVLEIHFERPPQMAVEKGPTNGA